MTQEQVSASCISSSLSIATQPLSTYLNTAPPEKTDTYIVKSFNPLSFFFWFIFKFTTNAVYSVVYLVHRILFSILSTTFQITVSAHSIVYVILVISIPLYACVRYYLTLYSRLPTDSKRQNPTIDTFLNSSNENETGEAQSYLDKFLSAIKIFGYLDNPVFHELTKSLQTQKIDSGEIIFIDECAGFSICVEGEIQVYSKIGKIESNNTSSINPLFAKNDNHNTVIIDGVKYQLLNIVKSGTPLSSFITVLNLLTDSQLTLSNLTPTPKFNPQRHLPKIPSDNFSLDPSNKNTFSAGNPDCAFEPDHPSSIEPNKESHSPELIAIPKNNCTISMIPKESFTRIASKFPKDTSHIIQMVLTKLHRVTFHTAHNFLDLTPNIFQTEINLNQLQNSYDKKLPKYLQNLAIDYIENENQLSADSSTVTSKSTNRNVRQKKNLKSKNLKVNSSKNLIDINGPLNDLTSRLSSSAFSPSPSVPSSPSSSSVSSAAAHFLKKEESDAEPKSSKNRRKEKIARISKPANQNCMGFLTSDGDDSILLTESTNNNFDIGMKNRRAESNSFKNKAPPTASIKGKSRHFVFNNKSSTNPGDLLSNVPLPRSSEVNLKSKLSELDVNELKDRTFSGDDEETEESTLRTALAEKISNLIGLDKQNFPANFSNGNSNGGINSLVSSPRMGASNISSGIRYVTPVSDSNSNLRSKYNKIRTFSTTSIDGINNGLAPEDSCSVNSDIYKSFVNYNNVKREFASDIKFFKIPKDTKIIKSKEQTPGIYYVIDGSFDVTYLKKESDFVGTYINEPEQNNINKHATKTNSTNHNNGSNDDTDEKIIEEYLYTIREGEIAGYLGTLIGSKSFFDVTANTDSYVAFLSREFFEFLLERYPNLHLSIAHLLLKVLDKKLYLTDYALEWIHLSAAEILYKQLDPANGIYIVLNGRLRSLSKNKSEYVILGEYGQGESMGEMEVLTKSKRLTTVISIRDSELARIPRTLFEIIALSNPSIMVQISRIVADRVKIGGLLMESESYIAGTASTRIKDEPMVQNFNNYRTLSLLPVSDGTIPLVEFAEQLATALEKVGKTVKILNQSAALSNLGKYAFDKLAKLKQGGYFSELEEKYDIVIYLCDAAVNSTWTKTCIQQGDCIILLADATLSPDVGEYERLLVKSKTTARTELVLLHPGRYIEPGSTHKWLKNRIWVHAHHHIQMQCHNDYQHVDHRTTMFGDIDNLSLLSTKLTDKFFFRMENIVNNNEFLQFLKQTKEDFRSKKHYRPLQEHKDDFMRLARLLTGQAIGLVLGGGGARGISHVGIIKALEDNGIPVDIIGGTSIGAFVGGLYAKDYDFVPVYGRAKTFAGRMGSVWRSLLDLTIPLTSYLTGHEFNRGIWKAFGDSRIEDFWIKYYANSTNITDSVMEIHTSGYAWRYIRASMTLASLLPPLTDDGNMLMDGGYIDNLTVTEMQRRGAKHIIAVDVGSVDDRSPMNYGDTLNGWWVLINRLNPLSGHANVPTMADIQMRLAYVASVNALERAKNSKGCSYLRPPIEAYATLAFGKFDEIYNVGLQYGTQELRELMKKWDLKIEKKQFFPSKKSRRRYSM